MLLSNMREPDWISVSCHENLVNTVICKRTRKFRDKKLVSLIMKDKSTEFFMCKSTTLLINDKCLAFLWIKHGDYSGHFCSKFKARGVSINKLSYFYHIFNAISSLHRFPILIFQGSMQFQIVKVYKLFDSLRFTHKFVQGVTFGGTLICTFSKVKVSISTNMFSCSTGGYILHKYTCDGIRDCPNDNSDETFCVCDEEHYEGNTCMELQKRQNVTHCSHNHFMNMKGACIKYDFKLTNNENMFQTISEMKNENTFVCNNGQTLKIPMINDLIPDFGPDSENEPILLAAKDCEPTEIHCMEGHIQCFNFTDICMYKLNKENHMIPCKNGGHLENCGKFERKMIFKCPDSYCVSWNYVCDGKWDCPFGEDETNNEGKVYVRKCSNAEMNLTNVLA